MKRVIVENYGPPEVLTVKNSEPPASGPGPGEVLVKVLRAGVNPVDTYRRSGTQGYSPDLPFCPGFEASGVIEALGPDIPYQYLKIGQPVYLGWSTTGTYGQWCIVKAEHTFPLPKDLNYQQGAGLFIPYFTGYRALKIVGGATAHSKVLVHGASGSVGMAIIQWAKYYSIPVWGTAGSEESYREVIEHGAEDCFFHHSPGYLDEIKEKQLTFDLIIEMNAHLGLETDLNLLRPSGKIVVVGSRGTTEITPRKLMGSETLIQGVSLARSSSKELWETHEQIIKAAKKGFIKPRIAIELPLDYAYLAHRLVMESPSKGKIILNTEGKT
jgi:NADPH2:quinone reductase